MFTAVVLLLASTTLCHGQEGRRYGRPGFNNRPQTEYGSIHFEEEFVVGPSFKPGERPPNKPVGPPNRPLDILSNIPIDTPNNSLEVLFSWKQLDFVFPDENTRQSMIQSQQFIPKNNVILDVDVYEEGPDRKVFVTLPRLRPGIPVTLATVSPEQRDGVTLLAPYPNWRSQQRGDCGNAITSVFRTHMDQCGRLWVLDSGNNNANDGANSRIVCPPQVLVYDVRNNDQLIGKFRIPSSMISEGTMLVTIEVDARADDCSDAFAYIADSLTYKMIVFSLQTQEFWRINNILFFPYPDQSRFNVSGVSFDLGGGLFGLAMGPKFGDNQRRLYFHCIASVKQSWVDANDLRNGSLWRENMNANARLFNLFSGSRPSQSIVSTMSDDGVMFFTLTATNELACWNSQNKFETSNIVTLAQDDTILQFNGGIKVYGNKLYLTTNRLQNYIMNNVQEDEVNYRVMVGDVRQLTRGTKCEVTSQANRFDSEYSPDSESVDFPTNKEIRSATNY